jgi:hypothetical protein
MSDTIEIESVLGTLVDMRKVSPTLRQQYRTVSRAITRHERAQAELKRIGQAILSEQAIKTAPKVQGDHAVMAKLMKCKQ